ncbi:MAG: hypothetical protein QG621_644 [Patescibacteria group bacterium]|nr:hypothetical protein [Patescibacteria group bacterium]
MKISCIICAYNEASRIGEVLKAVANHPLLDEVLVVDDASKDNTVKVVYQFTSVQLIALQKNCGKSRALIHGLLAAKNDFVMLLDADLIGITSDDVTALAKPIIEDQADVSLSLRKNALAIHHLIGIDFTSGERVIPRTLLADVLDKIDRLPHFGIESYMNSLIIKKRLRIAIVSWENVTHVRKSQKYGFIRGTLSDLGMAVDVLRVLSPLAVIRQNYQLLALCTKKE